MNLLPSAYVKLPQHCHLKWFFSTPFWFLLQSCNSDQMGYDHLTNLAKPWAKKTIRFRLPRLEFKPSSIWITPSPKLRRSHSPATILSWRHDATFTIVFRFPLTSCTFCNIMLWFIGHALLSSFLRSRDLVLNTFTLLVAPLKPCCLRYLSTLCLL